MGTIYRSGYEPNALEKIYFIIADQLYGAYVLVLALFPFLWDIIKTNLFQGKNSRLPDKISELLDPKVFARLSGRKVTKVEYSARLEQNANSTDRAWFKVKFDDEDEDTYVFAKVQAKTFMVRAMMSMFDVYRNELHAYAALDFPVRTCDVYIAKWTRSRFVLALGDLRHEGVEFPNLWDNPCDKDMGKRVISCLSKVHAKWWQNAPHGCWTEDNRPFYSKTAGIFTLFNIERRCPGLIPEDVHNVYLTALWHWDKVRAFYDRSYPKTMCHGDTHIGNFFIGRDGTVGIIDLQVKSEEHGMRDITYFLACSYMEDKLEGDEKELIQFYLDELAANGVPADQIPTFDQAWLQYRMWIYYTLYAFIFSGGISDLMSEKQSRFGISRIIRVMKRIDSAGALYDLLDGKI